MSRDEYLEFLGARADGKPAKRRPASIRPHDPLLAMRVANEQEAETAVNEQAKSALRRAG